jgi:tRNA(Ile)-lysidine synthase
MAFSPERLLAVISSLPAAPRYWVAYSGGLDSHVLLHALSVLRPLPTAELSAIHIDHGLHRDAADWSARCERYCKEQDIPLKIVRVKVEAASGESLEAVARDIRYATIAAEIGAGDILFTAHHQDDQAETVLLQLLRGSGPSGLAAMPAITGFASGYHARPLLGFSRQQLADYAEQEGLSWLEDPSNRDISFDRNFLRQQVIPLLAERWPSLGRTLSRSASHCGEAQHLINRMAQQDLDRLLDSEDNSLNLTILAELPPPRGRAVLRAWIKGEGFTVPDTVHLERALVEMVAAREERNPLVTWQGAELRRFRCRLYISEPLPPLDSNQVLPWDGSSPLELPAGLGRLLVEEGESGIPQQLWESGAIQVRFRSGGERCRPPGRGHSKSLKKLYQEMGIPPWQRKRLPLVFVGDQLVAVGDLLYCSSTEQRSGSSGINLRWEQA